jgi:hypothetical protein
MLHSVIALLLVMMPANGQFFRGTIVGTVTDESGAIVVGADVKLLNQGTNAAEAVKTGADGAYTFPALLPGAYRVEVSSQGFKTQTISDIRLEVNQTARIDVKLAVGEIVQRVEATASLQLLKTDTSDVGGVIANKTIVELPLNGRDYLQLARLIPGAIPSRAGATAGAKGVSRSVNVAGARDTSVSFLLDGVDTNDAIFQTPTVTPSVDAIQEFKIIADTYSAEFGRGSTQIITALKSGSNEWHSTLFWFNRNNSFAARGFFQPGAVARLNLNQFGGTLGGPVRLPKLYNGRDRTFFFVNFDGGRTRSGGTGFAYVPWAELRAGDFSGAGNPLIYDPDTWNATARTRQPFAGNRIPSTRVSPLATKVLSYYPSPNYSGQAGRNYAVTIPGKDDNNNGNIRLDHRFSGKDNFFGRYSILDRDRPQPSTLPYNGIVDTLRGQNVALNWVHIFTPALLNEARAGFNRSKYYTQPIASPSANPAKDVFGFKNTIDDPTVGYGMPGFGLSNGFSGFGPGTQYPANSVVQTYQYVDNVTWIRGPHTLKTGFDFRRSRLTAIVGNSARGYASFTGQFTNLPSAASTTGSSVADLLLGAPQTIQSSVGDGIAHNYTNLYSLYVQDDWKISPRLTLNLGLRYEYATPYTEKLDRFTIVDTTNRSQGGQLLLANSSKVFIPGRGVVDSGGSFTSRSLIAPDRNNVAPRLGFAWRPLGRTVVRGGAGLFFDVQEGNEAQFLRNNPPYLFAQNLASDPFIPSFRLDDLFPAPNQPTGAIQPFSMDITNRTPYLSQWNLTVERELMQNLTMEVGYVGSAGKKLLRRSNFQQGANILVKDPANPTPLASRVEFPNFSNNYIIGTDNGGSSTYHGLLTKVERRFSRGFAVLFSYTYSKAISDSHSSSNFDNTPSNPQCRCDLRAEKGPAAFDIRHRAVISYSYELPFGKGRKWLNAGGWADRLVGGWQLNGITALQSGPPFTLATPGDNANIGSSAQRPDVVGDPYGGVDRGADIRRRGVDQGTTYFNKAAFVMPALFRLGSVGKNTQYGPGSQSWDFSVFKNTNLAERLNLQLRAEFFNLPNHPNFGLPNRTINQPTTGMITGAGSPRIVQFGVKLIL